MRRLLPLAAIAALLTAGPLAAALAKGGSKPGPAKSKPGALPAGCERLADGREAVLSPDGKKLAFVRWVDSGKVDYHSDPIPEARVFVRDLATKKESKVPNATTVPVSWTSAGGLGLAGGTVVDPATGKPVAGTARLPDTLRARVIAWSRDGKRLAFVPDWTSTPLPQPGVPKVLTMIGTEGPLKELDFGNVTHDRVPSALAWSPDGQRLFADVAYMGSGSLPFRRVSVIPFDGSTQAIVSEMDLNNQVPTIHDERRPMDPLPGTAGPRVGAAAWDAAGAKFVYLHGTGDGNADVYLADAAGEPKLRQTTDGATKWSPALDPAARRIAFLTAKVVEWPNGLEGRALRVLDVLTKEAQDFPLPGTTGMPGNAAWTADGLRVVYEIHGGDAEGVYAQTVPAPKAAPAGSKPGSVELGPDEEIVGALRSGQAKRAEWAVEEAAKAWRASLEAPLREALVTWTDHAQYGPATAILRLFGDKRLEAALPEIRKALASKQTLVVGAALGALREMSAKDALPDVDKVRTSHPSNERKVQAAGLLLQWGDARGWDQVKAGASDKEADVRDEVCAALEHVPQAQSVEILLKLVPDDGHLYTTHGGDIVVGDHAVLALATITGQFFKRDVAKWKAWWKDEAKGVLAPNLPNTPALVKYEEWMNEREEEHQKKMREVLERFGKPR